MRTGSASSNTVSDQIEVLDEAIAGIPARYRRNLLITVDGAGFSHGLIDHITTLNSRPGYRVHYSIGWKFGGRERAAIAGVPQHAFDPVLHIAGEPHGLDEAGVVKLTALLRQCHWPGSPFPTRPDPHPG